MADIPNSAQVSGAAESGSSLVERGCPGRVVLERAEELAQTGSWDWNLETDELLSSDNMFRLLVGLKPGEVTPTPAYVSAIGCEVALDDFGTGFGSFTHLKRLPITYLKVDLDFVRDLATNRDNQHLVRAIVGLAREFGYETIAEGVEDAETLALVKEYGVDFAQGFHLGRPAPIDC